MSHSIEGEQPAGVDAKEPLASTAGQPDLDRRTETDHSPTAAGKSQEGNDEWEWELFEQSPEQWLRKRHSEWDDQRINQELRLIERIRLIERYEELRKEVREKDPDLNCELFG